MIYQEMVAHLKKPGQDLLDSWTPEKASAMHMLVGLHDEALELQLAFLNEDIPNVIEELGDMAFYVVGVAQDLGVELDLNVEPDLSEGPNSAMMDLIENCKRHLCYNKTLEAEKAIESMQGILAQLAGIGHHVGQTLEEIMQQNYDKLMKGRYPNGYSDDAANKRQDKGEAE
jgi:NTP pyrophosphatase (non-canonical NTP hydrolase)